jgi:hypothetical protein
LETIVQVTPDAVQAEFVLSYGAGDVDLHVYDSAGHHVGVNYDTGGIDLQIPGAEYSGPASYPERIAISVGGDRLYTVRVVPVASSQLPDFSVLMRSVNYHHATLWVSADQMLLPAAPADMLIHALGIGEIGKQADATGLVVAFSDLVGPGGAIIPAASITIDPLGTVIPAGVHLNLRFTIPIPADTAGAYAGQMTVTTDNAGSVAVPVTVTVNRAPDAPSRPAGPATGFARVVYSYSSQTTDPENGPVYYQFYWGDGDQTDWLGPYESGAPCEATHAWQDAGTYSVRATAKDDQGSLSPRSDPLTVVIAAAMLGDLNCDAVVTLDDIDPFVLALSGQAAYEAEYPKCNWFNADCNADGVVNFDDIDPFVAILSAG